MGIFDTHAHYDDEAFDEDREELIASFQEQGISYVTNIGADVASSERSVCLSEHYDFFYAAVGIHPEFAASCDEQALKRLEKLAGRKKTVAIGEIGLDYYVPNIEGKEVIREQMLLEKPIQRKAFADQIELAKKCNLPILVHSRDAAEDTVAVLKETEAEKVGGVIHCYSYSKEMARQFLDMGFSLGIGGVLTFKNGKRLRETVEMAPIDRLVLETDCPYISPEPYRGRRNDSRNLIYVAQKLAEIKQCTVEEIIHITEENAKRLYRL